MATALSEPAWTSAADLTIAGLHFRHQPDPALDGPQVIGHFHPKATVRRLGHKLGGRCFVMTPELMVLPAFGAYAGGLDVASSAFQAVLRGRPSRVFLCRKGAIHEIAEPETPQGLRAGRPSRN